MSLWRSLHLASGVTKLVCASETAWLIISALKTIFPNCYYIFNDSSSVNLNYVFNDIFYIRSIIHAKTASRNVAFKSGKLAESVFTSQADILIRQVVTEGSSNDNKANFHDLGYNYNADLYIFNQDDRQDFVVYNVTITLITLRLRSI